MGLKEDMDTIETRMAELAGMIKLEEDRLRARMEKGKKVIAEIADTPNRLKAQVWYNYLQNRMLRAEHARKALDSNTVLIQDGETYLVVDGMSDQTLALIKRAEELGAVVTRVEKVPKQEALL
jgi:hypothetical protein